MSTGACGIDCTVCRLFILGACSTCGAGGSREAEIKLAAQERILGAPCPILACACMKQVAYCLRDCSAFPCDNFASGPHPFSRAFLQMQERRRGEAVPGKSPTGQSAGVSPAHWEALIRKEPNAICKDALVSMEASGEISLLFLEEKLRIDLKQRLFFKIAGLGRERVDDPFLELICLVYLLGAKDLPLGGRMIGVNELKSAHFFQGPHTLKVEPLLRRFGEDLPGFHRAAQALGGEPLELGDAACALHPFPRIPLYFLIWEGDEEFSSRLSVLFDETIETHLPADALWGLVNLVSYRLLTAGIPTV